MTKICKSMLERIGRIPLFLLNKASEGRYSTIETKLESQYPGTSAARKIDLSHSWESVDNAASITGNNCKDYSTRPIVYKSCPEEIRESIHNRHTNSC